MIKVESYQSPFDESIVKEFRRDGMLIGWSNNGEITLYTIRIIPYELSRAQGFKYWTRYFPNRLLWDLPEVLQEAIEKEPTTYGEYTNRNGETVGYIG